MFHLLVGVTYHQLTVFPSLVGDVYIYIHTIDMLGLCAIMCLHSAFLHLLFTFWEGVGIVGLPDHQQGYVQPNKAIA